MWQQRKSGGKGKRIRKSFLYTCPGGCHQQSVPAFYCVTWALCNFTCLGLCTQVGLCPFCLLITFIPFINFPFTRINLDPVTVSITAFSFRLMFFHWRSDMVNFLQCDLLRFSLPTLTSSSRSNLPSYLRWILPCFLLFLFCFLEGALHVYFSLK